MAKLKKYFITGVIVIVPVFATLYVLYVIFNFIDQLLGRVLAKHFPFYVPGIGFLLVAGIILLVGAAANRFLRNKVFLGFEKWFSGLPVIKIIYPALKQVVLFLSAHKESGFKKVVLAEYPSRGIWSIGFLTNEKIDTVNQVVGKEMAAVFIPNTPSPLSGFVIFVPKEELRFPDISINAALNIIISGGVYKPKNQLSV